MKRGLLIFIFMLISITSVSALLGGGLILDPASCATYCTSTGHTPASYEVKPGDFLCAPHQDVDPANSYTGCACPDGAVIRCSAGTSCNYGYCTVDSKSACDKWGGLYSTQPVAEIGLMTGPGCAICVPGTCEPTFPICSVKNPFETAIFPPNSLAFCATPTMYPGHCVLSGNHWDTNLGICCEPAGGIWDSAKNKCLAPCDTDGGCYGYAGVVCASISGSNVCAEPSYSEAHCNAAGYSWEGSRCMMSCDSGGLFACGCYDATHCRNPTYLGTCVLGGLGTACFDGTFCAENGVLQSGQCGAPDEGEPFCKSAGNAVGKTYHYDTAASECCEFNGKTWDGTSCVPPVGTCSLTFIEPFAKVSEDGQNIQLKSLLDEDILKDSEGDPLIGFGTEVWLLAQGTNDCEGQLGWFTSIDGGYDSELQVYEVPKDAIDQYIYTGSLMTPNTKEKTQLDLTISSVTHQVQFTVCDLALSDPECEGVRKIECKETADCALGVCINGFCKECDTDAQCIAPTSKCLLNKCVDCIEDSDCGAGRMCKKNECISSSCSLNFDRQTVELYDGQSDFEVSGPDFPIPIPGNAMFYFTATEGCERVQVDAYANDKIIGTITDLTGDLQAGITIDTASMTQPTYLTAVVTKGDLMEVAPGMVICPLDNPSCSIDEEVIGRESAEEFPIFDNWNILLVLLMLVSYYFYKGREL